MASRDSTRQPKLDPGFVGGSGSGGPAHGAATGRPAAPTPQRTALSALAADTSRVKPLVGQMVGKAIEWKRTPTMTGQGATHVRTFHARMCAEGLLELDQQINAWLDAQPQIEVKNVTMVVGEWQGKVKEPTLVVQVWV